jgi:hypothetical protein
MEAYMTYKRHERILDAVSYALVFAAWLTAKIAGGEVMVTIGYISKSHIAAFFFVFLSGLLLIYLVARVMELLAGISTGILLVIFRSLAAALIFLAYTYIFFYVPGGLLAGGRPGISGGLGNFFLDFGMYIILAFIAQGLLLAKKELHHRFNTSITLFVIVLVGSLYALYFVFFATP